MKKILNKAKKIFLIVISFLTSIHTKVSAIQYDSYTNIIDLIQPVYGVPSSPPKTIPMFWRIAKGLIIPIIFIIGTIIYLRKSSRSFLRKLITIIIVLAIVVLACLGINYFLTNII